ncbi:hypothetical protein KCU69_g21006, partial [Aureobasidium melanogenum]
MVLQRLLVGGLGWRGHRLQTVVNAKSSGMLYEEKDLLQASTQLNALAIIIMQELFGASGMQQLGGILDFFDPEDVQPADVVRDPRDDDRTYNLKCQAARIQVIEEAHLPLGLKNVRSRDELLHIIEQKLMPIASDYGRVTLQQMFFSKVHILRKPTLSRFPEAPASADEVAVISTFPRQAAWFEVVITAYRHAIAQEWRVVEGGTGQAASYQSHMDFSHTHPLPAGRRHSWPRYPVMEGCHRYRRRPAKV